MYFVFVAGELNGSASHTEGRPEGIHPLLEGSAQGEGDKQLKSSGIPDTFPML